MGGNCVTGSCGGKDDPVPGAGAHPPERKKHGSGNILSEMNSDLKSQSSKQTFD